jgi:hypothetical protein
VLLILRIQGKTPWFHEVPDDEEAEDKENNPFS